MLISISNLGQLSLSTGGFAHLPSYFEKLTHSLWWAPIVKEASLPKLERNEPVRQLAHEPTELDTFHEMIGLKLTGACQFRQSTQFGSSIGARMKSILLFLFSGNMQIERSRGMLSIGADTFIVGKLIRLGHPSRLGLGCRHRRPPICSLQCFSLIDDDELSASLSA